MDQTLWVFLSLYIASDKHRDGWKPKRVAQRPDIVV